MKNIVLTLLFIFASVFFASAQVRMSGNKFIETSGNDIAFDGVYEITITDSTLSFSYPSGMLRTAQYNQSTGLFVRSEVLLPALSFEIAKIKRFKSGAVWTIQLKNGNSAKLAFENGNPISMWYYEGKGHQASYFFWGFNENALK